MKNKLLTFQKEKFSRQHPKQFPQFGHEWGEIAPKTPLYRFGIILAFARTITMAGVRHGWNGPLSETDCCINCFNVMHDVARRL